MDSGWIKKIDFHGSFPLIQLFLNFARSTHTEFNTKRSRRKRTDTHRHTSDAAREIISLILPFALTLLPSNDGFFVPLSEFVDWHNDIYLFSFYAAIRLAAADIVFPLEKLNCNWLVDCVWFTANVPIATNRRCNERTNNKKTKIITTANIDHSIDSNRRRFFFVFL